VSPSRITRRMIIPVRCFTCGRVLADKWEYWMRECAKRSAAEKQRPPPTGETTTGGEGDTPADTTATATATATAAGGLGDDNVTGGARDHFEPDLKKDLLDMLGLDRICCRRHMLTHVDIIDILI
jgi:DNA-directed RNA polymerase subunit N (RpoN/RPB10)